MQAASPDLPLRIALIGCGNIGSRLLQSLAGMEGPTVQIEAVEPSPSSRDQAVLRFEEARGDRPHTMRFVEAAPGGCDLGIIATDSRNRLPALLALAQAGLPGRLILEKFLFTRAEDFGRAAGILSAAGAEAWVNCSRNEWPGYSALKTRLTPGAIRRISVSGGDWGLACNGIHYLALVEYLTDGAVETLEWTEPPVVRNAKRPGYLELTGTLSGRTAQGVEFTLSSIAESNAPLQVRVEALEESILVQEAASTQFVEGETQGAPFQIWRASEMAPVFSRILLGGDTTLPEYSPSARLHLLAIGVLNAAFFGSSDPAVECPVT